MNKNKLIKKYLILLIVICAIGASLFIGVKSINKLKNFLVSINNSLASMSSNLESLQETTEKINSSEDNQDIVIKDSISNLKVKLSFNNEELYLNTESDNNIYELDSLNCDQVINVNLETNGNLEVNINGNEINSNQNNEIKIDKLSMDSKIKIDLKNKDNNDTRTYFINTLPSDFPQYNFIGESQYDGDYYLTIEGYPERSNFYLLKLNKKGEVVYYKHSENNYFCDFKKHNINGKVRYSYFELDNDFSIVEGACDYGDRVILDEKYNEIDRVNCIGNDEIKDGYFVENHDFIIIDDGHYIISTYLPMIVDNIPSSIESLDSLTKVLANVLQEIKDGEVIFQWNSTDYPELYELSVEGNEFNTMSNKWNDYSHFNCVTIDPKDNNLICSFRNLDSIIKIDRKTGDIIWILGGKGDQFNLTEEQKFSHQHNATLLDDNRILLFDNGNAKGLTRILEITLDEEKKKVTNFKEFSVDGRFSAYMGSVQKLDDKKDIYLIGWGSADSDTALFTEYDLKNKKVLCEMHIEDDKKFSYRVYKSE